MKKIIFSILLILFFGSLLNAKNIEIYFDFKVYSTPTGEHYVETHMEFIGNSFEYKTLENGLIQAQVEVTMYLKRGQDIIDWKKILVEGPEVEPGGEIDFLDVQRFPVENGKWNFELELMDFNDPEKNVINYSEDFDVSIEKNEINISDLSLVKAYAKAEVASDISHSGYDLLPFVSDYFPSSVQSMIFYAEVYNSDQFFGENEMYLLTYYIRNRNTRVTQGDLQVFKRQETSPVTAVLTTFDISNLFAGHYELVIEARDKENNIVAQKSLAFFRQKLTEEATISDIENIDITSVFTYSYTDIDEVHEYLLSCRPIASNVERTTIDHQIPTADLSLMQKYMYHFWTRRNPDDPQQAWEDYKKEVIKVNEEYSTRLKKGYDTDRGRIYLQYGPPNSMAVKHNNMSLYPYEVWHYYSINNFTNKRFLFYNTDHVSNDFALLHSDLPGEVKNNNWFEIMSQRTDAFDIATQTVNRNYSNTGDAELEILRDLYFNPR